MKWESQTGVNFGYYESLVNRFGKKLVPLDYFLDSVKKDLPWMADADIMRRYQHYEAAWERKYGSKK